MAALLELAQIVPVPGPVWGLLPIRPASDRAAPWRRPRWGSALAQCERVAAAAAAAVDACAAAAAPPSEPRPCDAAVASTRTPDWRALRRRLYREGLAPGAVAAALGAVGGWATQTLGLVPRRCQLIAAAALLDNRMAEMATGEGKTLAIGLAAAVAGLAGMPVHVVTANSYLAARDAARLAPLFAALGLRVTALADGQSDAQRRSAYHHDIVYATAKDLAFDFLRDRQSGALADGPAAAARAISGGAARPPLMRGLCIAILDEADSILLDEAEVPLILSRAAPQASRRAFLWQALALARGLVAGRDFAIDAVDRSTRLSPGGEERLAALATALGGPWLRPRYRREAVAVALAAVHLYRRDEHYLVKDGRVDLLDEVTGRVAVGRVWSRGLHTVVALKEGLHPPDETETVAQTTFQRFFQRYWRLCGISGTLREAGAELRAVYGCGVIRVPLHQRCRRLTLPLRRFDHPDQLFGALGGRVAALQAQGRPVLVGTDSVADSQRVSAALQASGVAHVVLNALHDADEAAIVAAAGRAGRVTVATRMAGRGTDIELDAAARAAGGLHVLSCQHNPSRRLDRQLAGRAGRHGDPGSTEAWLSTRTSALATASDADNLTPCISFHPPHAGLRLALLRHRWNQWREERRRTALRQRLLEDDLHWERRLSFAGPAA